METAIEALKHELFGDPDCSASDIKFYPGTTMADPEDIADQVLRALASAKKGEGTPLPLK